MENGSSERSDSDSGTQSDDDPKVQPMRTETNEFESLGELDEQKGEGKPVDKADIMEEL